MTSLGIDRRVINEEAMEATITLLRHNMAENIVPALNNSGHIVVSRTQGGGAGLSASAKTRRQSSVVADGGGGGGEAALIKQMKATYPSVLKTVGPTVLVMERLETLVQRVPLDDQQVFTVSSGAMLSLELEPTTGDAIKMTHNLHVASIGILTSIFRMYNKHRTSLVDDLFPIMLKMPVSKKSLRTFPVHCSSVLYPSGLVPLARSLVPSASWSHDQYHDTQYIQTMSGVILFFVQSCVVRPTYHVAQQEGSMHPPPPEVEKRFVSGLASCKAICSQFVGNLLQRCSKKGEDGGASEFRPILANLIEDLLLIFLVPEYPAAEMILLCIANSLSEDIIQAASSTKALQASESTYLNTAMDALGKICAAEAKIHAVQRERPMMLQHARGISKKNDKQVSCYCSDTKFGNTSMLDCDRCHSWSHIRCMGLVPDALPEEWICDACQLARIVEFEQDKNTNMGQLACPVELIDDLHCMRLLLSDYLSIVTRKTGVVTVQDAYKFHLALWVGQMEQRRMSRPEQERQVTTPDDNGKLIPLMERLLEMWNPSDSPSAASSQSQQSLNGMLHCLSDEGRSRMVLHLAVTQSELLSSFRSKVQLILKLMASETGASIRKLSVKAIEKVGSVVSSYLFSLFVYFVNSNLSHATILAL
jgi:cohesin loading factor subunit SCC2